MFGVPSCYGADDLMIQEMHNDVCRVCNQPVTPINIDVKSNKKLSKDTFTTSKPKETKTDKLLKYASIGAIVGGIAFIGKKIFKHFRKA